MTHFLTIMIGSNCKDKARNISQATSQVAAMLENVECSEPIVTPDYTGIGADYINCVISGNCKCRPEVVTNHLHRIEKEHGRIDGQKEEIALDIDIVTIDGHIVKPIEYNSMAYRLCRESMRNNLDADSDKG